MSNSHNLILIVFSIYSFCKKRLLIYFCLAVLDLTAARASSGCGEWELPSSRARVLLIAEASLVRSSASGAAVPGLQSTGSTAVAPGLSCSATPGILLDQGSNPHLLHRQGDSLPLSHHRNPTLHSCQQFFFHLNISLKLLHIVSSKPGCFWEWEGMLSMIVLWSQAYPRHPEGMLFIIYCTFPESRFVN